MVLTRQHMMTYLKSIHKNTPGTGMKDDVPARIHKKDSKGYAEGGPMDSQEAALSEGEYVIPADVVSMLGDGNTDAGAKILDQMCEQIRKTKGKHLVQGRQAPPLS